MVVAFWRFGVALVVRLADGAGHWLAQDQRMLADKLVRKANTALAARRCQPWSVGLYV